MNLVLLRVDDEELIRRIDSASVSVALYAPGVSVAVARALCRAMDRLSGAVKIVLDVSQNSVDMGYLEPDAVAEIWRAQCECGIHAFFHIAGLRLSSLFVDDSGALVYAPIAKLMEDENYEIVKACPSGLDVVALGSAMDVRDLAPIEVDAAMITKLCDTELKPGRPLSEIKAECERKVKEAETKVMEAERRAKEAEQRAEQAEKDAVEKYKAQFKMRKYEFSVHCQPADIGRKRAVIPPMFLVGLGNEMEKKLAANYRLFPDESEISEYIAKNHPQETIEIFKEREEKIRKTYLLSVPQFGTFVRCSEKDAFEEEAKELDALGVKVGEHIRKALADRMDAAIEALFKVLSEQWNNSGDPWFRAFFKMHPDEKRSMKQIFIDEMKSGTKGTDALVSKFRPEVTCHSTPIDEALTENKEFLKELKKLLAKRNHKGMEQIKLSDLITQENVKSQRDSIQSTAE